VNKQLTLKGVDTGGGQPVIDGSGSGNVVEIKATLPYYKPVAPGKLIHRDDIQLTLILR